MFGYSRRLYYNIVRASFARLLVYKQGVIVDGVFLGICAFSHIYSQKEIGKYVKGRN
jgi:hypothetical protein